MFPPPARPVTDCGHGTVANPVRRPIFAATDLENGMQAKPADQAPQPEPKPALTRTSPCQTATRFVARARYGV
jgi:hypothetical protein